MLIIIIIIIIIINLSGVAFSGVGHAICLPTTRISAAPDSNFLGQQNEQNEHNKH